MSSWSGNILCNWRRIRERGGCGGNDAWGNPAIQSVFSDSLLSRLKVDRALELGGGCEEPRSPIYALRYDGTGEYLASGDKGGVVRLWDARRSKRESLVRSWNAGGGVPILCVDFLEERGAQEKVVVSGGLNQRVCVYHSGSRDALPLRQFSCHGGSVRSLATIGGDVLLSAGDDGTVRRYDMREAHMCGGYGQECGNAIVSLHRRESRSRRFFLNVMFGAMSTRVEVYALAVHPSESYYFVIGGSDRLVRLYDMRMPQSSEEPRLGLPLVHAWLPGEWTGRGGWWSMAQVTGLAWSYDGSRIAASYSGDRIFIIDAAEAFKRGLGTAAPEGECRAKRRRCPARDEGDGRSAELDSGRRGRGGVDAAQDDVDYRHRRRRRHRQDVLVAAACSEEVLTREEDDDQRARLRATFLSSTSSLMAEAPSITVSDTSSEEGASSESSRTASRVASRASSSRDAPDSPEMGDEGSLFRGEESTPSGADRWDLSLDGEDDGSGPSLGNFSESSFYSSDSPDDLLQGPPAGLPAGAPGSPSGSESSTSNGLLSFLQRSSVLLFPPRAGAARSRWNRALYGYQCWNLISMEDIRLADRRMLGVMTGHINLATKNLQVFFFGGARHGCREYVVSGSDDGGIYIWSLSSMKIVQVLTERKDVGLVVPHPCSLQLASSSNGEISFWTPIGPPTSRVSRLERNFLRATMNSFFVENATSVSTFSRVVLSIDEASAPLRTSDTSADPTRDRGARRPGVVLGSADGPESVVILDAPALGCIIQ